MPLHRYGAQFVVALVAQLPAPLQNAAAVATPPLHVAALQLVLDVGYAPHDALDPVQLCAQAPLPGHEPWVARGVPVRNEQVPGVAPLHC